MRVREAKALLEKRQWSGAYYLSGYAVECGLKAIIATRFSANTFPDPKTLKDIYIHDLEKLIERAGLGPQHKQKLQTDKPFENNWLVVRGWTEASRYTTWTRNEAKSIVTAISDGQHGVMQWLESVW